MNHAVQPEINEVDLLNSQEPHYAASQNDNIDKMYEINQTNH